MVYNWLNSAQDWLFPRHCRLCLAGSRSGLELCADCLRDLPWIQHSCHHCALPLPADAGTICGRCQTRRFAFDYCHSLFAYQYPLDHLIQRIKFQQDLVLLESFGKLLAGRLESRDPRPERIIPVPLHRVRLAERGYNQSLELLRPLQKSGKFIIDSHCCRRIRATETQSRLPARQRRLNLHGAFKLTGDVLDQHILLVDDVLTTGSTLHEVAKLLKDAGARRVDAWVIARTVANNLETF